MLYYKLQNLSVTENACCAHIKSNVGVTKFLCFVDLPTKVAYEFSVSERSVRRYQSRPMIHWLYDESELMFEDVDFLVNATRAALLELKVTSGKRIGIASSHHPAALILSWACWLKVSV